MSPLSEEGHPVLLSIKRGPQYISEPLGTTSTASKRHRPECFMAVTALSSMCASLQEFKEIRKRRCL